MKAGGPSQTGGGGGGKPQKCSPACGKGKEAVSAKAGARTRAQWAGTRRRLFSRPPGASGRRGCPDAVALTKGSPGCATAGQHSATRTNLPWLEANARPNLPDWRPSQGSASPESGRDVPAGGTPVTTGSRRTMRRGVGLGGASSGSRERSRGEGPGCKTRPRGHGDAGGPRPGSCSPLGHLTLALPPPSPGYLGRIRGFGRWRRGGAPDRPLGSPVTPAPAHTTAPRRCSRLRAEATPPPARLSYSKGNQSPARLSGSNVRLLGARWGRAGSAVRGARRVWSLGPVCMRRAPTGWAAAGAGRPGPPGRGECCTAAAPAGGRRSCPRGRGPEGPGQHSL